MKITIVDDKIVPKKVHYRNVYRSAFFGIADIITGSHHSSLEEALADKDKDRTFIFTLKFEEE